MFLILRFRSNISPNDPAPAIMIKHDPWDFH